MGQHDDTRSVDFTMTAIDLRQPARAIANLRDTVAPQSPGTGTRLFAFVAEGRRQRRAAMHCIA